MFSGRRLLLAGLGALLLVGLVAGVALAQPAPQDQPNAAKTNYGQFFLDRLASALGLSRAQLDEAGKKAAGETLDKARQDGKLTQEQADRLRERVEQRGAFQNWPGLPGRAVTPRPANLIGAQVYLEGAAKALGLSVDDLRAQMRAGKSVADLAKEKNVTAEQVKADVIAAATAKLDQAVKDGKLAAERAAAVKNQLNAQPAERFLRPATFGVQVARQVVRVRLAFGDVAYEATAKALSLTPAQLSGELRSGKKLAEIAQAKGVGAEQVKATVVAAVNGRLDQMVQNGRITAERAQQAKERLNAIPAARFLEPGTALRLQLTA